MKKQIIIFSVIAAISLLIFIVIASIIGNDINTTSQLDISIMDFFYNIRGNKNSFLYYFCRIITELGYTYFALIIVVLLLIFTKCDYRAFAFIIGALFMVLLNMALKDIFQRERPDKELWWVVENDLSFPSGHSTTSGFIYMFLGYFIYDSKFNKKLKIVGYILCGILITIIPMTRLIFGVHYFTDVLTGTLNGIMVACIAIILMIIFKKYKIFDKPLFVSIYELLKNDDKKEEEKKPEEENRKEQ